MENDAERIVREREEAQQKELYRELHEYKETFLRAQAVEFKQQSLLYDEILAIIPTTLVQLAKTDPPFRGGVSKTVPWRVQRVVVWELTDAFVTLYCFGMIMREKVYFASDGNLYYRLDDFSVKRIKRPTLTHPNGKPQTDFLAVKQVIEKYVV